MKKGHDFLLSRMYFTDDDGYQNFLVFVLMLSSLILDNNKTVTIWISTGISSEKIKPFETNLCLTMSNLANDTVNLKFNNSVHSSSLYINFILHLYIVHELKNLPRNPMNNFSLTNCLFGRVKLVRNIIKNKFTYNGWGIAFDVEGSWSFGNNFVENVAIFGVDNISSSDIDNRKNNFVVLGEGSTGNINDSIGGAGKKLPLTLVKQIKKLTLQWWWKLLVCK